MNKTPTRTLKLPGGGELQLVLDPAVSRVCAGHLPGDAQVVIAIDTSGADSTRPAFGPTVRDAFGERLWTILTDARDSTQMCNDLLLAAYLASGLLDRGSLVVLCASPPAWVELLAAAVLLVRGFSQPKAIEAVQSVLPDSFPEIDDEVALAAIDHVRLEREALASNASRNSL